MWIASDAAALTLEKPTVRKTTSVTIQLAAGGGYLARLQPGIQ